MMLCRKLQLLVLVLAVLAKIKPKSGQTDLGFVDLNLASLVLLSLNDNVELSLQVVHVRHNLSKLSSALT